MAETFYEGEIITSEDPSKPDLVRRGNKWVPVGDVGSTGGATYGAPKLTEAQAKDGFNAKRMRDSGSDIGGLEGSGYDAGLAKAVENFGFQTPGPFSSPQTRKYASSQLEWADALLRLTTGAAATKDEINNTLKAYFPAVGDPPEVRAQKAKMRARVQADAITRAGPAVDKPDIATAHMGVTGRSMGADAARRQQPAASPAPAMGGGWSVKRVN